MTRLYILAFHEIQVIKKVDTLDTDVLLFWTDGREQCWMPVTASWQGQ